MFAYFALAFLAFVGYAVSQKCEPSDALQERWKELSSCAGPAPANTRNLKMYVMDGKDPSNLREINYNSISCSNFDASLQTKILISDDSGPDSRDSSDDDDPRRRGFYKMFRDVNLVLVNYSEPSRNDGQTAISIEEACGDAYVVSSLMDCLASFCGLDTQAMHVLGFRRGGGIAGCVGHLMPNRIAMQLSMYVRRPTPPPRGPRGPGADK